MGAAIPAPRDAEARQGLWQHGAVERGLGPRGTAIRRHLHPANAAAPRPGEPADSEHAGSGQVQPERRVQDDRFYPHAERKKLGPPVHQQIGIFRRLLAREGRLCHDLEATQPLHPGVPLDPTAPNVQPTKTKNLEAGIKASLFGRRLTLALAAYQEKLEGFQTSISYTLPNGTPQRGATNVGDIRARGFEFSLAANLGSGFRLTLDGNYNDAVYTRAPSLPAPAELSYNGIATIDATGQRAPYSPEWALSVTPSWDFKIGQRAEFYSYAQYSYTTSYGTGVTQSIYTQVPNQSNLNLRAGLRLDNGKYDVSLYANNATNERNIISQALLAAPSGAGVTAYLGRTVNYNQPARYGITLRVKY